MPVQNTRIVPREAEQSARRERNAALLWPAAYTLETMRAQLEVLRR